ncbi:MAG: TetR/AcrR family transcriptional regulator [Erysipelotrichaceae bacterium]|nr:TetR/AcrR family transcriptional regulator [Erysipelotrichaceae bacterium]
MKEKLMNKAIALWQKYGYDNISINRICRECGVTKGSFYHHFSGKEDLLDRYVENKINEVTFDKNLYEGDSFIEGIYNVLMAITGPMTKLNSSLMKVQFRDKLYSPHSDIFKDTEYYRICLDLYRKGQISGQIRDTFTAELLLDTAIIFLNGNYRDWLLKDGHFNLFEEDHKALEIILKK